MSTHRVAPVRRRPARRSRREQLAFVGLREQLEPTAAQPRLARRILNMRPKLEDTGGALMTRPGIFRMASGEAAGATRVQATGQFTRQNGTSYTWRVKGGALQTFDYGTSTWATVASGTGVLDVSARVGWVVFADRLVLSDGIGRPITWTGSAFATLATCPVLYGPPTVFYARLVGIKSTDRLTIVWSEVNDPALGYDAAPYNNAWTLGQTDQEPLEALRATNEALYYWRERSIGTITGQVSQEWRSTGVQDSVSLTLGTRSPFAITSYDTAFYFLDAEARPQRLPFGGRVQEPEIWEAMDQTVGRIPVSGLAGATAEAVTEFGVVLLGVPSSSASSTNDQLLVFDGKDGTALAIWNGFPFDVLSLHIDGSAALTLAIGTDDGVSYHLGHANSAVYDDQLASGTVAIEHVVTGTPLRYDVSADSRFDRLDLALRFVTSVAELSAQIRTPYGRSPSVSVSGTGSGTARWDVARWDVARWGAPADDTHRTLGFAQMGRWAEVTVRHQALGEAFSLLGYALDAVTESTAPRVP